MDGVESCKIVFPWGHFLFTCSNPFAVAVSFSHSAQRHRQTDRRTDDIIVAIANRAARNHGLIRTVHKEVNHQDSDQTNRESDSKGDGYGKEPSGIEALYERRLTFKGRVQINRPLPL